jgi:uncharacterized protein DUF6174
MKSIRRVGLLLTLAVIGCSSPFGPDEARELASARARWEARTFPDYTFETEHGCFCAPEQIGPVRITVRQGAIAEVTLLATGESVAADNWYTIEQLFDRIPLAAKEDGVEDVTAAYDPALGFPTNVGVRFGSDVLDAGSSYTVSAVGPAS